MNPAVIVILIGAVLLIVGGTSWAGLALIAIGSVAYLVMQRPRAAARYYVPRWRQPRQKNEGQTGVKWDVKDSPPGVPGGTTGPNMPGVEGGVFNLPIPMGELGEMLDFKHGTKIR